MKKQSRLKKYKPRICVPIGTIFFKSKKQYNRNLKREEIEAELDYEEKEIDDMCA